MEHSVTRMLVAIGPLKLWMESALAAAAAVGRASERERSETDNTTAKAPSAVPGADLLCSRCPSSPAVFLTTLMFPPDSNDTP